VVVVGDGQSHPIYLLSPFLISHSFPFPPLFIPETRPSTQEYSQLPPSEDDCAGQEEGLTPELRKQEGSKKKVANLMAIRPVDPLLLMFSMCACACVDALVCDNGGRGGGHGCSLQYVAVFFLLLFSDLQTSSPAQSHSCQT